MTILAKEFIDDLDFGWIKHWSDHSEGKRVVNHYGLIFFLQFGTEWKKKRNFGLPPWEVLNNGGPNLNQLL